MNVINQSMFVGKKLRTLRLRLDISQEQMAASLNISQSYYSAIEVSKRKITQALIEKITLKWKVKPQVLFADEVNEKQVCTYNFCPHCGHSLK